VLWVPSIWELRTASRRTYIATKNSGSGMNLHDPVEASERNVRFGEQAQQLALERYGGSGGSGAGRNAR